MYLSQLQPQVNNPAGSCCPGHLPGQHTAQNFNATPKPEVETIVAKAPLKPDTLVSSQASDASVTANNKADAVQKKSILTGIEIKDFANPKYGIGQKAGLAFIALYQKLTRKFDAEGNLKSKHGLCCRFDPSCSQYTAQAIKEKGLIKGGLMGAYRMTFECNPVQPVTKEYGFFKGVKMTANAIASELLGMAGINVWVADREKVRAILQKVAEGQKTSAPVA